MGRQVRTNRLTGDGGCNLGRDIGGCNGEDCVDAKGRLLLYIMVIGIKSLESCWDLHGKLPACW